MPAKQADEKSAAAPTGKDSSKDGAEEKGLKAEETPSEVTISADAMSSYGVKISTVSRHVLHKSIRVPARVTFNGEQIAHIGTTIQGRIAELKVKVGDTVQKGQEIAVIDSQELGEAENDYIQRLATIGIAKTSVETVATTLERSRALFQSKAGSLSDLQTREGEYRKARGELTSAEAGLMAAKNKLALMGLDDKVTSDLASSARISTRYAIHAPIAGKVIEREITLGEVVGPDRESLMVIADLSVVWVLADIPETNLERIHEGTDAVIKIPALPGRDFKGKISHIAPTTDPDTRTGRLRVELPNPHSEIRPGMFAEAQLQLTASDSQTSSPSVLVVPDDAVQTVDGVPAVFVPVEGKEHTFAKRPIKAGEQVGQLVPVLSGLKEGEQIVESGSFILKAEFGKGSASEE